MKDRQDSQQQLRQLKQSLKCRDMDRLYIFYGEEAFLLKHYLGQVAKVLLDPLTESFNHHRFNGENFDLQAFGDAVENLPMMAETTFVQADDIDLFKLNEADRTRMGEILSDIPEYCTVIFTYETLVWKPDKRYKKFWDILSENAVMVEFAKQDQRDLAAWITRHFAARSKRISNDLCLYLIDITDGTMTSLAGEIEKICAYSGADEIRRSDIDAVTEPVLEAVVFQMTGMLSEGRYGAALEKLQQLLKLHQEPLAILGAIGSHFRQIGTARTLLDNGKTAGDLQKLYGMQPFSARKVMDAARRVRPELCARAAVLVLEADRKIKTSYDDPQRLLEMLIMELAQEARNG